MQPDNDHVRSSGEVYMCFGTHHENCTKFRPEYEWEQSSDEHEDADEVVSSPSLWHIVLSALSVMARNILFWVFALMVFQRLQLVVAIGYLYSHGHFNDIFVSLLAFVLAFIFRIAFTVVFQHVSFEERRFIDEHYHLNDREKIYFHVNIGSRVFMFQSFKCI